LKNPI